LGINEKTQHYLHYFCSRVFRL